MYTRQFTSTFVSLTESFLWGHAPNILCYKNGTVCLVWRTDEGRYRRCCNPGAPMSHIHSCGWHLLKPSLTRTEIRSFQRRNNARMRQGFLRIRVDAMRAAMVLFTLLLFLRVFVALMGGGNEDSMKGVSVASLPAIFAYRQALSNICTYTLRNKVASSVAQVNFFFQRSGRKIFFCRTID